MKKLNAWKSSADLNNEFWTNHRKDGHKTHDRYLEWTSQALRIDETTMQTLNINVTSVWFDFRHLFCFSRWRLISKYDLIG